MEDSQTASVNVGIDNAYDEEIEEPTNNAQDVGQEVESDGQRLLVKRPRGGNKKKKSEVWSWVSRLDFNDDDGKYLHSIATCNQCKLEMRTHTVKNGTTGVWNHLKKCPGNPYYIPSNTGQPMLTQSSFGSPIVPHTFDQKRHDMYCVRWIIRAELPFRIVEHDAFKEYINDMIPRYKIPNRRKIASLVWDMFLSEKEKMLKVIGDLRVSVTTDTWTSIQNINYMVVTAHFLDCEWNLHKRVINFVKITSHKGDDLGRVLDGCLNDWGIKRVFSITVDNATSNDKVIDYMKKRLKTRGTLLLDGIHLHMRCTCHIINLIVKDGMKELNSSIEGIRNCVKFIHSSPARLDMFREVAILEGFDKMANIPLDVVTRWNATYIMLNSSFKYKDVFARMGEENDQFRSYFEDSVGPPVDEDWVKATSFAHFLKKFYDATIKLSATKTPTSNMILITLVALHMEIERKASDMRKENETLQKVATMMRLKFAKYWGSIDKVNPIIFIAQALDPRYKFDMIECYDEGCQNEENSILNKVKRHFNDLLMVYKDGFVEEREFVGNENDDSSIMMEEDEEDVYHKRMLNKRKESRSKEIFNEIDKYLNDPVESLKNMEFVLLDWWKGNRGRYPILSKIAKDVFALPSSTVASENAFSLGGRVVDPFRASLTPKMAEALVCSSDWLRGEQLQLYKEPTEEEVEFYNELEEIEKIGEISLKDGDAASQTQIPSTSAIQVPPPPPDQLTQRPPLHRGRGRGRAAPRGGRAAPRGGRAASH